MEGPSDRGARAGNRGARGWCLEIEDLVVSKCVAGREKDERFVRAAFAHGLADRDVVLARLADTDLEDSLRAVVEQRVRGWSR